MILKKALIFHPALAPYRVDLFNQLRHHFDLLVVFYRDSVVYHQELDNKNLQGRLLCTHDFLLSGFTFRGKEFRIGMGKIIKRFRPDVVVTHEFSYSTLYHVLLRKLCRMRFAHILWTAESRYQYERRMGVRKLLRFLLPRLVDGLIVYSEQVKACFVSSGVSSEKIFICANHQDEKVFQGKLSAAREIVDQVIRQYRLEKRKIALYVGRLSEEKNLGRLVEAFARVSVQHTNAMLVFVGDGSDKMFLQGLAEELLIPDKVLFAGHQENQNLYVWYLLTSFLVLPSWEETYGAVVNEALLAGVTVLCSSHAGGSVLVREGENGYIVDPEKVDSIVVALAKALTRGEEVEGIVLEQRESLMPIPFERDVMSFVHAVRWVSERV